MYVLEKPRSGQQSRGDLETIEGKHFPAESRQYSRPSQFSREEVQTVWRQMVEDQGLWATIASRPISGTGQDDAI